MNGCKFFFGHAWPDCYQQFLSGLKTFFFREMTFILSPSFIHSRMSFLLCSRSPVSLSDQSQVGLRRRRKKIRFLSSKYISQSLRDTYRLVKKDDSLKHIMEVWSTLCTTPILTWSNSIQCDPYNSTRPITKKSNNWNIFFCT